MTKHQSNTSVCAGNWITDLIKSKKKYFQAYDYRMYGEQIFG